jgi:hypothetical protein
MPVQVEVALISALVTFLAAAISGAIAWNQYKQNKAKFLREQEDKQKEFRQELEKFRHERQKWLIDLQAALELEKYKTRIASYPQAFMIIGKLSHRAREKVTPEIAGQVAYELNDWFYSTGGMCADISTRGAIRVLRRACLTWGKQGSRPSDFYRLRNNALFLLRNDLGLQGLEELDFSDTEDISLLKRVKGEVIQATKDVIAQDNKDETT